MLAGAGFGNHPAFAHAEGQHRLAERVVDFVGAGVIQILALQIDLRPPALAEPLGVIQRRWPADVMLEQVVQFAAEGIVAASGIVGRGQFDEGGGQRFRDVAAAELAESTCAVWSYAQLSHGRLIAIRKAYVAGRIRAFIVRRQYVGQRCELSRDCRLRSRRTPQPSAGPGTAHGVSPKKLSHGPGERPWLSDGWECGRRFAHFLCAAGYGWREDARLNRQINSWQ